MRGKKYGPVSEFTEIKPSVGILVLTEGFIDYYTGDASGIS